MNVQLISRMEAWIDAHFDEMIKALTELIRIPSVSRYDELPAPYGKECLRALETMRDKALSFGFAARSIDDRCLEIGDAASDAPITLWCHLDVVPAGEGWTYTAPFEPVKVGDYLIGRGASDNKGPAMACLYILRMLKELGVTTKHALKLCLGTDEEKRMSDVEHYARTQPAAALNIVADSGFPVCYAEKGIIEANLVSRAALPCIRELKAGMASNIVPDKAQIALAIPQGAAATSSGILTERAQICVDGELARILATGIPAHSAHPQNGVNAIHELTGAALGSGLLDEKAARVVRFFNTVNDDYLGTALGIAYRDEISGETTCAGTMTGLTDDGRAYLHVNIRYSVSADAEKMLASIAEACAENGCELAEIRVNAPNFFPPDAPVVDALTKVFNELSGQDAKPYVMSGGTYARKLPNALCFGMGGLSKPETDLFQPGHGGAHQADEGLYLPNLKKAMVILAMGLIEADTTI